MYASVVLLTTPTSAPTPTEAPPLAASEPTTEMSEEMFSAVTVMPAECDASPTATAWIAGSAWRAPDQRLRRFGQ